LEVAGSVVPLVTVAELVIQPLPRPVMVVTIVNDVVPPLAMESAVQRTIPGAETAHPGEAEANVVREGSESVTTTFCASPGPWLVTVSVHVAVMPLKEPVFVSARSALVGVVIGWYVAVYVAAAFATML
jgi:hypothetical protein